MLFLTNNEVKNIITMQEVIGTIEKAFKYYSNYKAVAPKRTQIEMSDKKSIALFMPGYSECMHSLGLKIATVFPNDVNRGLKTTNASIIRKKQIYSFRQFEPVNGCHQRGTDNTEFLYRNTGVLR